MTLLCKCCKKMFQDSDNTYRSSSGVFCSEYCYNLYSKLKNTMGVVEEKITNESTNTPQKKLTRKKKKELKNI